MNPPLFEALRALYEGGATPRLEANHADETCRLHLREGGVIYPPEPYADTLTLVDPRPSWHLVARLLSLLLPGQVWPSSQGATWILGRKVHYLTPLHRLKTVQDARLLHFEVTGAIGPYSTGGVARRLLAWTGISQPFGDLSRELKRGLPRWPYYKCLPGTYPSLYLWDCQSYHYHLLKRLPSPRAYLSREGHLGWHPLRSDERRRWDALLDKVAPHKRVRNSLVGSAYSQGKGAYYINGRRYEHPRRGPGPLSAGASVVYRTAYELTHRAVLETGSPYAAVDSVFSEAAHPPQAWTDVDLPVGLKGEGEVEIHFLQAYRIGLKTTKPYDESAAHEKKTGRALFRVPDYSPRPGHEYWPWLLEAR